MTAVKMKLIMHRKAAIITSCSEAEGSIFINKNIMTPQPRGANEGGNHDLELLVILNYSNIDINIVHVILKILFLLIYIALFPDHYRLTFLTLGIDMKLFEMFPNIHIAGNYSTTIL
jgi:hypothetical protein